MPSVLENLPKPFFVLAPMDDVTDTVFRQIIVECAPPDVYFTEFVNVDGLQSAGRAKLLPKLRFTPIEQPLIAQLWGKNPDNFRAVCSQIADGSLAEELGLPKGVNFAGIDLNMGCPAKSEVQNGTCSALMLPINRELALAIINAARVGLNASNPILPLSVKTRLGYSEVDLTWHEFLLYQKLNMLTIHGRTKKQMSKVPADWEVIRQIRELRDKLAPDTLIVGNGDVFSRAEGEKLAKKHGLDGIMIGRGIFHDPYVFSISRVAPWKRFTKEQKIALYRKHVELFAKTWNNNERKLHTLNKFCKIYVNDFDGAKELREQLMSAKSADELLQLLTQH